MHRFLIQVQIEGSSVRLELYEISCQEKGLVIPRLIFDYNTIDATGDQVATPPDSIPAGKSSKSSLQSCEAEGALVEPLLKSLLAIVLDELAVERICMEAMLEIDDFLIKQEATKADRASRARYRS